MPLIQGLWLDLSFEGSVGSFLVGFAVAIFAGGVEEIGLRGLAHEQLRSRYGTFWSGILIGVPWVVWHLPLHWLGVGFEGSFLLFAGGSIAFSVLLGWLHDRAGGSVVPVIVAHATIDGPAIFVPAGPVPADVEFTVRVVALMVYWGLAMGVLAAETDL